MKSDKTQAITDVSINELSLVFGKKDGLTYRPINPEAKVLAIKSGQITGSLLGGDLADKVKAAIAAKKAPADAVEKGAYSDLIEFEGSKYDAVSQLLAVVYSDLSNIFWLFDDDTRKSATETIIDNFLSALDEVRSTGEPSDTSDKAGARHSKKDREHIDAIQKSHAEMAEHIGALTSSEDDPDDDDDDDAGKAGLAIAARGITHADPGYLGEAKFPLDTVENVKAAITHFADKANLDPYKEPQQKKIAARIELAKKALKIEDEAPAEPVVDEEKPVSLDTKAMTEALAPFGKALELLAKGLDEFKSSVDTRFNEVATAQTEIAKATAATNKSKLELANAAIAAARKTSATGAIPTVDEKGETHDPTDTGEPPPPPAITGNYQTDVMGIIKSGRRNRRVVGVS
jgi:hypothetical protein